MTGFADRWAANSHLYADNVDVFLEDQWIVRDAPPNMTLGPDNTIRLIDLQREVLREMFRRDDNGRLVYNLMLYSTIKKSGKTEIEGGVAEWAGLTFAGTPEEFFIGNDKEQAQTRAFAAIGLQMNLNAKIHNPVVASFFNVPNRFTPSLSIIPFKGGGFLKSIPVDFAGEAGANPLASFWDELWGVDRESQRRLWDEMTPPPTRRDAFRFVATYAGFRGESELLWELYERIVGGDDKAKRRRRRIHPTIPLYVSPNGREIAYWDEGVEARRMPWQTPEYYAAEKAANRPEMYARIHENRWQENATAFIEAERYDVLPRQSRDAFPNENRYPVYVTVDAAHKRDTCYAVAVEYLPIVNAAGRPMKRVIDSAVWRPEPGKRVVIPEDTALPWIERCIETMNVKGVGFDPNHFETPAQRLRERYRTLRILDITQSVTNLTKMGQTLYDDIVYAALIVLPEPTETGDPDTLRQHVLNAAARQTGVGYQIVKLTDGKKIDGAVALAMALMMAGEHGAKDIEARSGIYIFGGDDDDYEVDA